MKHSTEITQLHAKWQSLQPLKTEDGQRLWAKLRLEWNYHSNHIEGNTLTYGETASLLIHDQAVGDHSLRNYVEMKAHDLAIEHLRTMVAEERPLSESDIRDLNQILLKEAFWKDAITPGGTPSRIQILPGQYKLQPNNVRTADGSIFKFTAPEEVSASMQALVDGYRDSIAENKLHPIEIAAKLHHEFVLIHPFGDGNGRTARLLVNYILMNAGYPSIIVPAPEKDRYLAALRQADAGDLQPLTDFLAKCAVTALERAVLAAEGKSIEDPDDLAKQIEVFKKQQSGEGKVVSKKSAESIRSTFQHSFMPLFEEFVREHRKLDELFSEVEITLFGIHPRPEQPWQDAIEEYLASERVDKLTTAGMDYKFKMFKGSKPFSVSSTVFIQLDEYQYSFERFVRDIPTQNYDDPIPESERHAIVKELLEFAFKEITKKNSSV